jgi:hypothetical protein
MRDCSRHDARIPDQFGQATTVRKDLGCLLDEDFTNRVDRNPTVRFWTLEIAFGARADLCH